MQKYNKSTALRLKLHAMIFNLPGIAFRNSAMSKHESSIAGLHEMSNGKPQRGRPKGSGIDDTTILHDVAHLMAADPQLKPTTAIKAAGITDPSAIRRLREKLRQPDRESVAAAAIESMPVPRPAMACSSRGTQERLSHPAQGCGAGREMRASDEMALTHDRAPQPPRSDSRDMLVAWMSLGIAAFNAALQAQQVATEQLMRLPPVYSLMRQQVALNELAIALCAPRRAAASTLH